MRVTSAGSHKPRLQISICVPLKARSISLSRFGGAAAYENDAQTEDSSDGRDARRMGDFAYFALLMRWFAHAEYHDGLLRIVLEARCGPERSDLREYSDPKGMKAARPGTSDSHGTEPSGTVKMPFCERWCRCRTVQS